MSTQFWNALSYQKQAWWKSHFFKFINYIKEWRCCWNLSFFRINNSFNEIKFPFKTIFFRKCVIVDGIGLITWIGLLANDSIKDCPTRVIKVHYNVLRSIYPQLSEPHIVKTFPATSAKQLFSDSYQNEEKSNSTLHPHQFRVHHESSQISSTQPRIRINREYTEFFN